jgi:hypothetical protein
MEDQTNQRQAEILTILATLVQKVEEGRSELKLLRTELGLDGPHGRIPVAEAALTRLDIRINGLESEIRTLQATKHEGIGRSNFINTILALLGGGAGGVLLELAGKFLK